MGRTDSDVPQRGALDDEAAGMPFYRHDGAGVDGGLDQVVLGDAGQEARLGRPQHLAVLGRSGGTGAGVGSSRDVRFVVMVPTASLRTRSSIVSTLI